MSEGISYYTVKLAAFVALRSADRVLGLAGAELAKVLGRLGNDIFEELKGDAAKGLTSNRNVKEDQRVAGLRELGGWHDCGYPDTEMECGWPSSTSSSASLFGGLLLL
jgi:hypothetical protein